MDDGKACLTISKQNDLLEELDTPIVKKKRNITVNHLGSKGLHFNLHGIARFPMNLNHILIGDLYINSLRNNFEIFVLSTAVNLDTLMISETTRD